MKSFNRKQLAIIWMIILSFSSFMTVEGMATCEFQSIDWAYMEGFQFNTNDYYKKMTATGWGNAGAHSNNALEPGEEGEIKIEIVDAATKQYVIGFSDESIGLGPNSIEYGWYIMGSAYKVLENGEQKTFNTGINDGDVFIIRRSGGKIKYIRNGVLIKSTDTDMNEKLIIGLVFMQQNIVVKDVFSTNLCLPLSVNLAQTSITHSGCESNDGSINIVVQNGLPPYQFSWSNGSTTEDITNLSPGLYTVDITDSEGSSYNHSYQINRRVDQSVNFAQTEGIELTSSHYIKKTASTGWGNAGGISNNVLEPGEEGQIRIEVIDNTRQRYVIGFSDEDAGLHPSKIEYAWYLINGSYRVYENADQKSYGGGGVMNNGNIFIIERSGGWMHYFKDEKEIFRRRVNMDERLQVVWTFYQQNFIIKDKVTTNLCMPGKLFAISSGDWHDPNIWSYSSYGNPAGIIPDENKEVIIDGYQVSIVNNAFCKKLILTGMQKGGELLVGSGVLNVLDKLIVENGPETIEGVLVNNSGALKVGPGVLTVE